jgi:hypothetical protein
MELLFKSEKPLAVGDMAAIKPSVMKDMENHCHKRELPVHNYGKVVAIATPHAKDSKGNYLHPYPFTVAYGKYNWVDVEFPNKEVIGFSEKDLYLLY